MLSVVRALHPIEKRDRRRKGDPVRLRRLHAAHHAGRIPGVPAGSPWCKSADSGSRWSWRVRALVPLDIGRPQFRVILKPVINGSSSCMPCPCRVVRQRVQLHLKRVPRNGRSASSANALSQSGAFSLSRHRMAGRPARLATRRRARGWDPARRRGSPARCVRRPGPPGATNRAARHRC